MQKQSPKKERASSKQK